MSTYRSRLFPWAITLTMPGESPKIIRRYKSRKNAEDALKLLKQQITDGELELVFIATEDTPKLTEEGGNSAWMSA